MYALNWNALNQLHETTADPYQRGAPLNDIYHAALAIQAAFPELAATAATAMALDCATSQQQEALRRRHVGKTFTLLDAAAQRALVIAEQAPTELELADAGAIAIHGLLHLLPEE